MAKKATFLAALCAAALCAACDQKVDTGDDKLTGGNQSIQVVYNGGTPQTVEFAALETQYKFNDAPVVAVTDVVLGSGLVLAVDGLWLDFVGSDGYSPLDNENCSEYSPTPASIVGDAYIERGTRNLLWEEALGVPGCIEVNDVATVYVADDPADLPGGDSDSDSDSDSDTDVDTDLVGHVAVSYGGATEEVQLGALETAELDGETVVLLPTIFAQTSFAFDLADVVLSFEGSDGYNPTEEGTCTDALPAPGALAPQAGINAASNDLEWDPALAFPGCAHVKVTAVIYVDPA